MAAPGMTKTSWKLQEFVAHASNVSAVALGKSSGRLMATGGEDCRVNLWSVNKPNCIMSLTGHTSPVESVRFNPSEKLIVAGSQSGSLRIWNMEEAKIQRTLMGHKASICSLDFHPYGEFVASGSLDTNIKVESSEKCNKQLYVYETLLHLQQGELSAKEAVRRAEAEVLEILAVRAQEESDPQLMISIYDTERNEKSKEQREALERAAQEERLQSALLEQDYLASFLVRLGDPERLTRAQAQQVKDDCLHDLKQRLIEKANLIQARFEKETQELQKKQQWYQENQTSMTQEVQDTYTEYCSEAMFRIQILEARLTRHKELAPQKYLALEDRLNKDSRLCEGHISPQPGSHQ